MKTNIARTTKKQSVSSYLSQSNANAASRNHRLAHIHAEGGYTERFAQRHNVNML